MKYETYTHIYAVRSSVPCYFYADVLVCNAERTHIHSRQHRSHYVRNMGEHVRHCYSVSLPLSCWCMCMLVGMLHSYATFGSFSLTVRELQSQCVCVYVCRSIYRCISARTHTFLNISNQTHKTWTKRSKCMTRCRKPICRALNISLSLCTWYAQNIQ